MMAKRKSGFYWHDHHDVLMEWCYDYKKRLDFIISKKPKEEQKLRIKLFQPVRGKLPIKLLKAGAALDEAKMVYNNAFKVSQCLAVYNKTMTACKSKIEALHKKTCLNCPWNGFSIF